MISRRLDIRVLIRIPLWETDKGSGKEMLKMKRSRILCLVLVLCLLLAGCGNAAKNSENAEQENQTVQSQMETDDTAGENESAADTQEAVKDNTEDGQVIHTAGADVSLSNLSYQTSDDNAPVVFFTSDISSEGLIAIYKALDWNPTGKVAVKVSTGESERSNYLRGDLIADLVQSLDGTIVECMTAYGGNRAEIAKAKQAAEDHGFTAFADFDLLDEEGEIEIPFDGGARINRAIVGSHIDDYDYYLILSHFKGHSMAGLGGGIKNVAIGMSSRSGKVYVHSAGTRTTGNIMHNDQDAWLEALPETVKAVSDYLGEGRMIYISVMNRLSVDCDCDGNPAEPDMHDIGILASFDPVALDQACVDFIYAAPDGGSLIRRMGSRNGIHAIEHGEEIGLGSRLYRLEIIDE